MAREFTRTQRVADFIRKELAVIIQMELRDPRLGIVGITDVEVSRDLANARVYVTVMGCDDKQAMEIPVKVLNGAAGFLRSRLAKVSTMRTIPALHFHYDESILRGSRISSMIDEAIRSDKDMHTGE
jgi:ribosome-binding factor A